MRVGPDGPMGQGATGVFLTDFGLARTVATGSRLTRTGEAIGTPAYMPPEQARGDLAALSPATDVWGIGCVLYEMLAGRRAFSGETPAAIVGRVLLGEPPRLRDVVPEAPRDVERVIHVCLGKRPRERYAGAASLAGDLDRILRGESPRARPPGRRAGRLAAVAIGAALLAGGAAAIPRGAPPEPPPSRPAPGRAEQLAAQAGALETADTAEAERLLGEALRLEPTRSDWRLRRGLSLWLLGRGAGACAEWGLVETGSPDGPRARLYEGLEAFTRWDGGALRGGAARDRLRPLAGRTDREGRLAAGVLAAVDRDWATARRALAGLDGWESALVRGYVEGLDPAGDRVTATREFDTALAQGIRFAWLHVSRGLSRWDAGDEAGAEADLDEALRLDPGLTLAHRDRGNFRLSRGDLPGAIQDYDVALAAAPASEDLRLARAFALQRAGREADARADYEAVLGVAATGAEGLYRRGRALSGLGRREEARQTLDEAIRLDPAHAEAHFARATLRARLGDAAGAVTDYTEALRGDPYRVEALRNRAALRATLGDHRGAIEDSTDALRRRPSYLAAWNDRAVSRMALGDFEGAVKDCNEMLRIRPDSGDARVNRGLARRRLGDLAGAAEDLREAVRLVPSAPEAHANLALVLQDLGRWEEAEAAYSEFLGLAPTHPEAARFRRWRDECRDRARAAAGAAR